MKIILAALNAKYIHSNLAVYDIEAYARKKLESEGEQRGSACLESEDEKGGAGQPVCTVEQIDLVVREYTINHNLDQILQELYHEKAKVYAFSCYIWNIYEILTITKELKKVLPAARIWLGGPEVSYDAENYLEQYPFLDGIIVGEGEVTFYELTETWRADGSLPLYQDISGIVYRDADGSIIRTPKRPLMSLDDLPFVYHDLRKFQNKILYYETSRGCPYSCSYCLSSIDKKVRFRSFSLVKKELDFFLKHNVPQVKFVDRTFNCHRGHSFEIWKYIAEHDNGVTNFHFEIAADLIGEEELQIFEKMRPGLIQLEIGLQSTNPDTIREIRRVMDVKKVKDILLKIKGFHNIHQHLDLIAGLPYEDFLSFQKSFNDAYEMKPDQLQLGFLKVLKGSYMGEQIDSYELKYRDSQPYEVLCTKWIRYDEILILKRVEEMVEVYYNSDQFEHVLPYVISFFTSPYLFYEALGSFYEKNDFFGIGFKREARYTALREFCQEHFLAGKIQDSAIQTEEGRTFSSGLLDDLLTFDYYLRENAKKRPLWKEEEPISKKEYQAFFKNGGNAEISLRKEGYDSKAAARMMHIEPISVEAIPYLNDKISKQTIERLLSDGDIFFCLFDYEKRDPLSKDAETMFFVQL